MMRLPLTNAQRPFPGAEESPTPFSTAPRNVVVSNRYQVRSIATGLDFPTAIAFSSTQIWVAEAGSLPGFAPKFKQ